MAKMTNAQRDSMVKALIADGTPLSQESYDALTKVLINDHKVRFDVENFSTSMMKLTLELQEIVLRSQLIAAESAEGHLRTIDACHAMKEASVPADTYRKYKDFALTMLAKNAPDVERLERERANAEVTRAAESLEKSGVILKP